MSRHRVSVVCDQNAVLLSREFQERRVIRSAESASLHIEDVDGRLARPQPLDDVGVEVFIRQEPNRHARFKMPWLRAGRSFGVLRPSGQTAQDPID